MRERDSLRGYEEEGYSYLQTHIQWEQLTFQGRINRKMYYSPNRYSGKKKKNFSTDVSKSFKTEKNRICRIVNTTVIQWHRVYRNVFTHSAVRLERIKYVCWMLHSWTEISCVWHCFRVKLYASNYFSLFLNLVVKCIQTFIVFSFLKDTINQVTRWW